MKMGIPDPTGIVSDAIREGGGVCEPLREGTAYAEIPDSSEQRPAITVLVTCRVQTVAETIVDLKRHNGGRVPREAADGLRRICEGRDEPVPEELLAHER